MRDDDRITAGSIVVDSTALAVRPSMHTQPTGRVVWTKRQVRDSVSHSPLPPPCHRGASPAINMDALTGRVRPTILHAAYINSFKTRFSPSDNAARREWPKSFNPRDGVYL